MASFLLLLPSSITSSPLRRLRSHTLPFRDCRSFIQACPCPRHDCRSPRAHERACLFNFLQNSLAKASDGCSRPQTKMGRLASSINGILLSCLLLGSCNDCAFARDAVFGPEFFSEQKPQMEPRKGYCATCLGVVDETLGACSMNSNCVSTFDDRPSFFMAPWEFPGKLTTAFQQMNSILLAGGGRIVEQGNRYIHAIFTEKDGTIDDLEFLFSIPSEDATVNIRSASRRTSENDYGRNRKRLEKIRQALTWEEVPVLRNRSRTFFFLESPWDTFGPEPPPGFQNGDKLEFVPD